MNLKSAISKFSVMINFYMIVASNKNNIYSRNIVYKNRFVIVNNFNTVAIYHSSIF